MRALPPILALLLLGCNGDDKAVATGSGIGGSGVAVGIPGGNPVGAPTGTATGQVAPDCTAIGGLGAIRADVSYGTIQEAIDADAPGEAVWVCPGTYTAQALTVQADVWLQGVGGRDGVVLQGTGTEPVVLVANAAATVVGMTISGGDSQFGGGVNGSAATSVDIDDCVFDSNTGEFGAGAYIGTAGSVSNSVFTNNTAVQYGGGLAFEAGTVATIEDITVSNNTAVLGGGFFAFEGSSVTGSGTNTVSSNSADSGAGVYGWSADISGVSIDGNAAVANGGGAYLFQGGSLINATVTNNSANAGGGFAAAEGAVAVEALTVDSNTAVAQGGGVHFSDLALVASGSFHVSNNTCDDLGGGAFIRDVDWTGGGLLAANVGTNGGGGLYVSNLGKSSAIDGLVIDGNSTDETGGGIDTLTPVFSMSNTVITNNSSGTRAGGFYASLASTVTGTNVLIDGNDAGSWGGGLYLNGGATATCTSCDISNNASERGAGIYLNGGGALTLDGGSVISNGDPATLSGGGARTQDGTLDVTSSDWGTAGTDNAPDDVYTGVGFIAYSSYGLGATFSCDSNTCTP